MQITVQVILSLWMLLATMPFCISMHYCKGMDADLCASDVQCCSSSKGDLPDESITTLCCSTDCCSELSITSIPEEQFKNSLAKDFKEFNNFAVLIFTTTSPQIQQTFFLQKVKNPPPLLVKKVFAANQSFLC